ncbi:MAG: Trm112 family protein [Gammaproteobacteria bacterium]
MTILDKKLLQILVCPISKKPLVQRENELFCFESKLAYPVKDGIPIMLPEKARKLSEDELKN